MTDLLDRLRAETGEACGLCHEAVIEIERLGRLVAGVRKAFNRECDDADAILRTLGLDPANWRTDGGSLVMPALLGAVERREVTAGTAASQAWVMVPRVPTDAMVDAICAAVAQADWPNAYFEPAQQRSRRDARLAWLEAVAAAPTNDGQPGTKNVGVLLDAQRRLEVEPVSDEPQSAVAAAYGGMTQTAQG